MTTHLLVFTPVTPDGLQFATVQSVVGQCFAGEIRWEIGRCNPYPPPDVRNVLAQYSHARTLCLSGPYDALVTIEQDMIVPPHALTTLWDDGAAVVYATYMLRHGMPVINALRHENSRNLGMSLSLYSGALAQASKAERVEVSGVGFGCTLIRRHVLEAIPFRADGVGNAPDMPFARDCLQMGFQQVARFNVRCGHIHEGATLEIENNSGRVKVTVLQAINIMDDGNFRRLSVGETVELEPTQAKQLAEWGDVKVVVESTKKKKAG